MPDPKTLGEYESVMPGSGERLLRAFESVTVDASARDDRLADAEIWIRKTGLGWIIFFALLLFGAGIVFFAVGKTVAGSVLVGLPILAALTSIITAPIRRRGDDS